MGRSLVLVRSSSISCAGRRQSWSAPNLRTTCHSVLDFFHFASEPTMDVAEREDILNDALQLFGGEKVDESGVVMYGPLQLAVAQKVGPVVLLYALSEPCDCTNKALSVARQSASPIFKWSCTLLQEHLNTGKHSSRGSTLLSSTTSG